MLVIFDQILANNRAPNSFDTITALNYPLRNLQNATIHV